MGILTVYINICPTDKRTGLYNHQDIKEILYNLIQIFLKFSYRVFHYIFIETNDIFLHNGDSILNAEATGYAETLLRLYFTKLHGVTTQKTVIFIFVITKTSFLM